MVQSAASTWNFQLLQGAIHASSGYLSSLLDQNLVTHGIPWNPMDVGYMWCVFTQCCSVVFWEFFVQVFADHFWTLPESIPSSLRPFVPCTLGDLRVFHMGSAVDPPSAWRCRFGSSSLSQRQRSGRVTGTTLPRAQTLG